MIGLRSAVLLLLVFAVGAIITAGIGGATGVFDRGPTEADVRAAEERGAEESRSLLDVRMAPLGDEEELKGYERGREANEWLSLERLPNPDGWFAGVMAGRAEIERAMDEAYAQGYSEGETQGRDEALAASREQGEGRD